MKAINLKGKNRIHETTSKILSRRTRWIILISTSFLHRGQVGTFCLPFSCIFSWVLTHPSIHPLWNEASLQQVSFVMPFLSGSKQTGQSTTGFSAPAAATTGIFNSSYKSPQSIHKYINESIVIIMLYIINFLIYACYLLRSLWIVNRPSGTLSGTKKIWRVK